MLEHKTEREDQCKQSSKHVSCTAYATQHHYEYKRNVAVRATTKVDPGTMSDCKNGLIIQSKTAQFFLEEPN